jgi:hypothetical protein
VKALIRRFSPNVRVVFPGETKYKNAELQAPPAPDVDDALQPFGLRTDMRECATITVHGLPPGPPIRYQTSVPEESRIPDVTYLVTCRVVADTRDPSAMIARRHAVDIVFDRIEDACPRLFSPRRLVTLHEGAVWRRIYGSTDTSAWITHGRVRFADGIRRNGMIDIGAESDWAKAPLRLECGSRNGAYFAHILPPN